jgi:hypothetical protein
LDTLIEQIALTHMADTPIMEQGAWLKAAPTARQL